MGKNKKSAVDYDSSHEDDDITKKNITVSFSGHVIQQNHTSGIYDLLVEKFPPDHIDLNLLVKEITKLGSFGTVLIELDDGKESFKNKLHETNFFEDSEEIVFAVTAGIIVDMKDESNIIYKYLHKLSKKNSDVLKLLNSNKKFCMIFNERHEPDSLASIAPDMFNMLFNDIKLYNKSNKDDPITDLLLLSSSSESKKNETIYLYSEDEIINQSAHFSSKCAKILQNYPDDLSLLCWKFDENSRILNRIEEAHFNSL
ncbi:hypothetical protein A3Q56_04920 [Intoshia linei]|uniref:Uncharacterized protein n=1 Tax=Intoshia linei TaxID=1819745 RepID=A0A177B148_9BILA|nr:hypothetical protein A3Q56_04920 [Intoshia linei]